MDYCEGHGIVPDGWFLSWDDAAQYAFERSLSNGGNARTECSGVYGPPAGDRILRPAKLHPGHDPGWRFSTHLTRDGRLIQLVDWDGDEYDSFLEEDDVEEVVTGLSRLMIHVNNDPRLAGRRFALMVNDCPVPKTATAAALARGRGLKRHFHARPDVVLTFRKGGERKLCHILKASDGNQWCEDDDPYGEDWMEGLDGRYETQVSGDILADGLILAAYSLLAGPHGMELECRTEGAMAETVRKELLKAVAESEVKVF